MKKEEGFTWHCHHNILMEWCYDYETRVEIIKANKPANEIPTRLRLFKFVKGKLPKEIIENGRKRKETERKLGEARLKWGEARRKWHETELNEAWRKYDEAWRKYDEAWQELNKSISRHLPELEALHKRECGCKEWNGSEIVFGKKQESARIRGA